MALPKRYVTCPKCGKTLEQNKSNFTWFAYPKDNKRCHEICKNCEETQLYRENGKDGLLKCHICGKYFPEEVFHKKGGTRIRNNRDTRCPKCKAEQNKAKRKEYSNEEKLNTILLQRFHGAKTRATKYNIPFNLTLKDIHSIGKQQKGLCAISKLSMTFNLDQGRTFTNVSIDQINPHLGYTKDNIQLVCMAVNQMKSDMSLEELYTFCEAVLKNKNNCFYIYKINNEMQFPIFHLSSNNLGIVNSFQYTSRKEMNEILSYIKDQYPENIVFTRSTASLIREWRSHNLLYKLRIQRDRTKDVDLEYPQKGYYRIAYFVLSLLYVIK